MATLLHIFAHPTPEHSQTMRIAQAFLDSYRETHADDTIEALDLYKAGVPHLTAAHLSAMFHQAQDGPMTPEAAQAWTEMTAKIQQFTTADKYLVTVPMWNFGVPSILKAYIDHVMLAGYTFRFTGPGTSVGMMTGRPLAIINSRGGVYSLPPMDDYEMCVKYLRNVFDFLGFAPITEIVAEGTALVGPHEQEKLLQPILARAREVALGF